MKEIAMAIENDEYTDFMTSQAIRSKVYQHIDNMEWAERAAARDKLVVLYKMGVPWKGIMKALLGDSHGVE